MKNKQNNISIILIFVISLIILFGFMIYCYFYYNIKLTTTISIIIGLLIMVLLIYLPCRIEENKRNLIDELFLLDIYNKYNYDEHIRITQKNVLFKYKNIVKYYYIFPKSFSNLSLRGENLKTPTYSIIGKTQLLVNEVDNIIEKINRLNNIAEGDVIVNYKGNKKLVNSNDINKIFKDYFISI